MTEIEQEYLTTQELAELLRIKQRKVYDLVAAGEIPCSRAMGKLLFPRAAVNAWLARHASGHTPATRPARPNIFLGSHDPLLEWALKQSGCGIASLFDGSFDGVDRFALGEGIATGLHIHDPATGEWNVAPVSLRFASEPVVLVEWAWRERGLIVTPALADAISGIKDLAGRTVVPRQAGAGSQALLAHLAGEAGIADTMSFTAPARSETDAALAVRHGKADVAFGLRAPASQLGLAFVPLINERFDIMVERRAWFEPPMQRLLGFCRSAEFAGHAATLGGYDVSGFGRVRFNGA